MVDHYLPNSNMESKRISLVFCVGCLFHTLKQYHFTVGLLCLFVVSVDAYECPIQCKCRERSVECEGEIKLPLNVSKRTQSLTLTGNHIVNLTERTFSAGGTDMEIETLLLPHNNIEVIESCAFCGLPGLLTLDLSHNKLMVVSPEAFSGLGELRYLYLNNTLKTSGARQLPRALSSESLRNLQRLDLAGNHLTVIPVYRFGNLNLTTLILTNNSLKTLDKSNISNLNEFKKIRIYLSMNPFECNCELEAFYFWLKNSSQCADSSRLVCAQPEGKKGLTVEELKKEDVECINAELEAVSYVFLGIVLALIGVVFLMVLYLNRRGIKRWLNNIREACRDQMEVYHYRYEQDSDPRLANVAV